jgi:predicted porin
MTRTLAAIATALLATSAGAQAPAAPAPAEPAAAAPATPAPAAAAPAAPAPAPAAVAAPAKDPKPKKGYAFAIGSKSQISFAGRAWGEFNNVRTDKGDAPNGKAAQNLSRFSNNASYFQVAGERTFAEGWKGVAQFEAEVGLDGENGTPFSGTRNTFVGLDSPYGMLQVGRFDSPVKEVGIGRDPGAGTGIFGYYSVFTGYRADRRLTNAIMYTSPETQGLELSVAFSLGEAKFASTTAGTLIPQRTDPYVVSGALQYRNKTPYGPLFLGVGYEFRNDCANPDANPADGPSCTMAALGNGDAPNGTDQVIRVSGDFKLTQTFTKIAAVYDRVDSERPAKYGQPKLSRSRDAYWGSITQGIMGDKHQLIFNAGVAKAFSGTGITTDGTGLWTYVGQYRYWFDSNLFLYVAVTQIFNEKNSKASFGSGSPVGGVNTGWAVPAGATVTGWGTGLRYNF